MGPSFNEFERVGGNIYFKLCDFYQLRGIGGIHRNEWCIFHSFHDLRSAKGGKKLEWANPEHIIPNPGKGILVAFLRLFWDVLPLKTRGRGWEDPKMGDPWGNSTIFQPELQSDAHRPGKTLCRTIFKDEET